MGIIWFLIYEFALRTYEMARFKIKIWDGYWKSEKSTFGSNFWLQKITKGISGDKLVGAKISHWLD